MEDRTFSFSVFLPTTGYFLSILKIQNTLGFRFGKELKENYILLKNLVQLAKLKFPNYPLNLSIKIVLGSVKSSKLLIKN